MEKEKYKENVEYEFDEEYDRELYDVMIRYFLFYKNLLLFVFYKKDILLRYFFKYLLFV